jgi:hypothetical protein
MRAYRFYKDEFGWFIDLKWFPKRWRHHLALVAGADTLLSILSEGRQELTIKVGTKYFDRDAFLLRRKMILPSYLMGAFYESRDKHFPNEQLKNNHLWLCWVTLLVFGRYPKTIYYKAV